MSLFFILIGSLYPRENKMEKTEKKLVQRQVSENVLQCFTLVCFSSVSVGEELSLGKVLFLGVLVAQSSVLPNNDLCLSTQTSLFCSVFFFTSVFLCDFTPPSPSLPLHPILHPSIILWAVAQSCCCPRAGAVSSEVRGGGEAQLQGVRVGAVGYSDLVVVEHGQDLHRLSLRVKLQQP